MSEVSRDRRRMSLGLPLCWLCVVSLASLGCDSGPEMAPARGTVSVKGTTLTHGKVLFEPVGGGEIAVGEIDEDGSFVLTTFEVGDGALVGEHTVGITQRSDDAAERGEKPHNFGSAPGAFQVESGEENVFTIDVDLEKGWQLRENR